MASYVKQAGQLKSDLVAFPEICNTLGATEPWQFEPLDGPTLTAMSRVAKENSIYVVCPLATLENGTRYNSSVLVGRQGQIEGIYHKNFPTHGELDVGIIPGTKAPIFETDFGRVGLSICFDLNYWEVGSALCANQAEVVIWSSMWEGSRMLTKWAIEFGFFMAASYSKRSSITDNVGREIVSLQRNVYDRTGGTATPLVTATIDMDRRLLHHDENLDRLEEVFGKYGGDAVYAEWLPHECLLILGSQMPGVSTDQLIEEFNLEPMRDYLARVRQDRQKALEGNYPVKRRG
jgi:predicted amidohydrolase